MSADQNGSQLGRSEQDPGHYDESYYESNGQIGDRPALRFYVRLADRYGAGGPYFDFGCGTGHLLRRLSGLGPASGFEISDFSAARARETAPGCTVTTALADITDHSVATLTAIHVVEHVDDETADEIIKVWKRVVRPGGRMLVVTPDLGGRAHRMLGESWDAFSDPTHINLKSHGQWRRFFADRGLEVVLEGSDGMWNPPYAGGSRLWEAPRYALPALGQFLAGRLVVRPGQGESSIFVLEAR
ncbi:MAG: methyltransferase domain-containing protein [Geodermatophilaceae bacterium]